MAEPEPPWSVEIPQSKVSRLVGPDGSILTRLCKATGCEIEVSKHRPKKQGKAVFFQGQRQMVDEDGDGDGDAPDAMVKVFIRGAPRKRQLAADVLRGVANGDDPEDLAAQSEGALVFPHEIVHPDRAAWARWRLQAVAHARGARAHLGQRTVRLSSPAGPLVGEAADALRDATEAAFEEAQQLVELSVEARDDLEPEGADADPAVAPLVDQYGVIVRVCDQDDNAVCDTITVRVIGPSDAAKDAGALLSARFIDGRATASVLQLVGQVQSMTADMAKEFEGDVQSLEQECQVKVRTGRTTLWIEGDDSDKVTEARGMLCDVLQFYLPQGFCRVQGLKPPVIEHLYADADLGVLMSEPDCVVMLDEHAGCAWICGAKRTAVQARIDEAVRLASEQARAGQEPPIKKRRVSALTFHSESLG